MTTSTTQPDVQIPEGFEFVCKRGDIPARGKKTVHIGEATLLIIACESGLFAIEDRCPQSGGSIAHGKVLDDVITTPTTGARYSLRTGRYLGSGQWLLQSQMLRVFPLRQIGDRVYVRMG